MTSLKRSDGPTRADTPIVELGRRASVWSRSIPLATWTDDDIAYVSRRPRPAGAPALVAGLPLDRVRADDPPGGGGRGRARRALVGSRQDRVRPARLVPRDLDNPYGIEFRGRRDRGLKFVRPYRNIGELNSVEQMKLARHPFEVAQAVIDTYSKQGPDSINQVPGEMERLKWVGMYPQKPGRRRVHDAYQGAGRGHVRRPGARGRGGGRRLRRRARRQPGLREPLRRPHDPPGHPAALDPHRRRAPDLAALLGGGADDRPGLRRLGPQRLLVPRLGHRPEGGRRGLPGGPGPLGLFHGQPRVRQPAPQVEDRGDGVHRGLRPDRDQRRRAVAGRARRRHRGLQRADRRWALGRRAHGVGHRRVHPA